jgi:hypothetical protein
MEIRSPFPGMDPWLELFWEDVHQRALTYAADALQQQLPGGLRARLQERVYVETPAERIREVVPDIEVVEGIIEIVDAQAGSKLVTAIELLNVSNKRPGPGMEKYRQRQREVTALGANLVEIDLLRAGERVFQRPAERIPPGQRMLYEICVCRPKDSIFEVYPMSLRERLPMIRIPLRAGDDDVTLDLQALIEQTYEKGAYDFLDYSTGPVPALAPEDAAWADSLLKSAGKR